MKTGVISDVIDCPQCGLPCQKDTYYIEGEERVICNWCGYHHIKSHTGTKSSKGYGSIHYVSNSSNGSNPDEQIIPLKAPLSLSEKNDVIYKILHEYNKDKSGLYVWNETHQNLECAIGYRPLTLEEHYEKQYEQAVMEQEYNSFVRNEYPNHICSSDECEEF